MGSSLEHPTPLITGEPPHSLTISMMGLKKILPNRYRRFLPFAVVAVAILIPAIAFGVPGSGAMVSEHSTSGQEITRLYNIIAKICVGILIIVEGILFYAIFKFRRTSDDEQPEQVHGHLPLEVTWTLAALAIQIYIGWITIDVMFEIETEPEDKAELVVEAVASQWNWKFRYPEQQFKGRKIGGFSTKDLVIPANARIELDVTSDDVLHAIFIPGLGVKIDAVPGRYNYWWFTAAGPNQSAGKDLPKRERVDRGSYETTRGNGPNLLGSIFKSDSYYLTDDKTVDFLGYTQDESGNWQMIDAKDSEYAKYDAREYAGLCAELCGKDHWNMYFRTVAMTHSSFFGWLEDREGGGGATVDGAALYREQGCDGCHGGDGEGMPGRPPLKGTRWTNELGEDDDITKEDHIEVVLVGSDAESLEGTTTVLGEDYTDEMQALGKDLYEEQVAALVNHERTSWGNSGETVTAEDVRAVREDLGLGPKPMPKAGQVDPEQLVKEGEPLFAACSGCHGSDGKGPRSVPHLDGNPTVVSGNIEKLVETVVTEIDTDKWPGVHTPAARGMSDREVAALLTYIRQAWNNDRGAVQPVNVRDVRENLDTRQ